MYKCIAGHEFQAVILSTLEPLESDSTSSNPTKSLVNPKIFNTAVSRSKSFVVAVGDPFVLLKAEEQFPERCWMHYLRTCLDNNTVFFPAHYRPRMRDELKEKLDKEICRCMQYPLRSGSDEYVPPFTRFQPLAVRTSKSGPYYN